MITITLKNTDIQITCKTAEECFWLYNSLGTRYEVIINGDTLKKMGPMDNNAWFGGYTRSYFKKYENNKEKNYV